MRTTKTNNECTWEDGGTYCAKHDCGATDDLQCGKLGCTHCHAMQRLVHGEDAYAAFMRKGEEE